MSVLLLTPTHVKEPGVPFLKMASLLDNIDKRKRAAVSAIATSPEPSKRLLYTAGYMIDSGSVVSVVRQQ